MQQCITRENPPHALVSCGPVSNFVSIHGIDGESTFRHIQRAYLCNTSVQCPAMMRIAMMSITADNSPVHPGEKLRRILHDLRMSQYRLAKQMRVSPRRINEIVLKKRRVTSDTALRLGRCLGTSAEFWLELQIRYDLHITLSEIAD